MSAYEEELIYCPNINHKETANIQLTEEHDHFSFKEGSSSNSIEVSSLKKHQESHRHVIALLNEGLTDNGENNSEEEKQARDQFQFKGETPVRINN